jgi:hypothetical protein
VLAFSALGNFASGVATVGSFFLAESAWGFSTAENFRLGVLLGVTYTLAAWRAGPVLRALSRHAGGLSSRGALAAMSLALGALCLLPYFARGKWVLYLFIGLYAPITGIFWPLVESYLSGGRSGEGLRRALGGFNVTWSGSLALAMWIVAPHVASRPFAVFLALALVHVASLALVPLLERDPGRHVEEQHHAPASYRALLSGHRILLVATYLALFAASPWLPAILERIAVLPEWRTALGSVWMPARVAVFWLLGRWHGWHGRWAMGGSGAVLLALGFVLTVAAPELAAALTGSDPGADPLARSVALAVLVAGQLAFGAAVAALYTANLYDTLVVGEAAVDAGGAHEGLIGLGYTLGPVLGWSASGLASAGVLSPRAADIAVLVLVAALILAAGALAWRSVRRASRGVPSGNDRHGLAVADRDRPAALERHALQEERQVERRQG